MRSTKLCMLFVALIALSACSEPTIDASTDETWEHSVQKVRLHLSQDERVMFDLALDGIALDSLDAFYDSFDPTDFGSTDSFLGGIFSGVFEGVVKAVLEATNDAKTKVRTSLDGKTGEQVILEYERVVGRRERREILELEEKKQKWEMVREQIANFKIVDSRFYKRKGGLWEEPILELKVKNGTDRAISRVYFEGTLASPGRSTPWLEKSFSHRVRDGLIWPDEEAVWYVEPGAFSEWGAVKVRNDMFLTVKVNQLYGSGDEVIYSAMSYDAFDRFDQKRLDTLKEKYNVE